MFGVCSVSDAGVTCVSRMSILVVVDAAFIAASELEVCCDFGIVIEGLASSLRTSEEVK